MKSLVKFIALAILVLGPKAGVAFFEDLATGLVEKAARAAVKKAVGDKSGEQGANDSEDSSSSESNGVRVSKSYRESGLKPCEFKSSDEIKQRYREFDPNLEARFKPEQLVVNLHHSRPIWTSADHLEGVIKKIESIQGQYEVALVTPKRAMRFERVNCQWIAYEWAASEKPRPPVAITSREISELGRRLLQDEKFRHPDFNGGDLDLSGNEQELLEKELADYLTSFRRVDELNNEVYDWIASNNGFWANSEKSKRRLKKLYGSWQNQVDSSIRAVEFRSDGTLRVLRNGGEETRRYFAYVEPKSGETLIGITHEGPEGYLEFPLKWKSSSEFVSQLFSGVFRRK